MTADLKDENVEIDTPLTVGERLRVAREAKKISISDVATELRLSKNMVEHLENDRWSELHGRPYARGYISNYVKFLGLQKDDLLEAFNREYTSSEPNLLVKQQGDMGNKKVVWLPSLLIVIVLTVAYLAYEQWSQATKDSELIVEDDSSLSSQSDPSEILPTLSDEVTTLSVNVEPITDIETATIAQENDIASDQIELISSEPVDEIPISVPEVNVSEVTSISDIENTVLSSTEGILDLKFSADCWAEVRDADAKILLSKVMKKGDAIVLMGKTPLAIKLGRAEAVSIKFNDKEFDVAPYIKQDVARFTVGAES